MSNLSDDSSISTSSSIITDNQYLLITSSPLESFNLNSLVLDPNAGGIATFIGITRNTFQNKIVVSLEYECYIDMALKELKYFYNIHLFKFIF